MSEAATPLRKLTLGDLHAAAERLKNWGRWGPDDQIGTLNYTAAEDIVAAARLVRKGNVMSLALPFDEKGPQGAKSSYGAIGRFNPIHVMLRAGTDAYSGVLDHRKIRGADDMIIMPTQCGTQWDGLGHIFYGDRMWNGRDCRTVTSFGAQECGIEQTRAKMVGRGVLLDIPKMLGLGWLPDGFAITPALLDQAEARFGVRAGRGDFLLVRTGHLDAKLAAGNWDGYSGGDAPGLAFETLDWLHARQVAAIATGYLGRRGAAEPDRRCRPAVALDRDPDHRPVGGRDLRAGRACGRLRRRRALRVHVRCTGAADHRRGRLADQPARD